MHGNAGFDEKIYTAFFPGYFFGVEEEPGQIEKLKVFFGSSCDCVVDCVFEVPHVTGNSEHCTSEKHSVPIVFLSGFLRVDSEMKRIMSDKS